MAATVAMAKGHPVSFLHTLLSLLKRTFPALGNLVFMKREWGGVRETGHSLVGREGPLLA